MNVIPMYSNHGPGYIQMQSSIDEICEKLWLLSYEIQEIVWWSFSYKGLDKESVCMKIDQLEEEIHALEQCNFQTLSAEKVVESRKEIDRLKKEIDKLMHLRKMNST